MICKNKKSKIVNKKAHAPCHGFTFIEIMLVITIIGILSSIALVSLSSTRSNAALESSARQVASAIQLAHTYALQGKKEGGNAVCGFGFIFTSDTDYRIYYQTLSSSYQDCAHQNASIVQSYNSGLAADSSGTLPGGATLYDSSSGPYGDGSSSHAHDTDIYFMVPDGENISGSRTVCLEYANSGSCQETIGITDSGAVATNRAN